MGIEVRKGQGDVKLTREQFECRLCERVYDPEFQNVERWVAAPGVMIVTPVYWYQAPSVLKLMMDRLVCADGGSPDQTTTHGKNVEEAKALELEEREYPRHLAGAFSPSSCMAILWEPRRCGDHSRTGSPI